MNVAPFLKVLTWSGLIMSWMSCTWRSRPWKFMNVVTPPTSRISIKASIMPWSALAKRRPSVNTLAAACIAFGKALTMSWAILLDTRLSATELKYKVWASRVKFTIVQAGFQVVSI